MNTKSLLVVLFAIPAFAFAQVTDRVILGDDASENSHGLITYCPTKTAAISDGLLGQKGRYVTPFKENPFCGNYAGIYGGEYCFVLRVDGSAQNYLTLRINGSEAYTDGSRYHVQIDEKNLQTYERSAVDFSADKAPGAFCYSTMVIPRVMTDGKKIVTVRIRSLGRYWGYASSGDFASYQYAVEYNLPPIYAVYSSTNPLVELNDERQGERGSYKNAPAKNAGESLTAMKAKVENTLETAIKGEVEGDDFKPAYNNNNFNVVQCMGYAYQRGIYGTTSNELARKIRVAIDSMVYINNLCKAGANISRSAKGQTATKQSAGSGWGGLFGGQGMGMYLLWKAGELTDDFLNQETDLGAGGSKTRREQWIEAFRESFDAGLTYSGRRYITNQFMESAHSVYGAALALYALDNQTYHNAPKIALRMMREAVGLDEYTGVPVNAKFDGSIKDSEGYPTYQLGDSNTASDGKTNYWGHHFHTTTKMGNGREQGWTCTSCYGSLAGRICDMYLATRYDPFLGENGDEEILKVAVNNAKNQSYFTYPNVDGDGYRGIIGESSMCWRNRYDPGKNYYGNLMAAYLSNDTELMGYILQAYKDGHYEPDTSGKLFSWYTGSYWLADALNALDNYAQTHSSDYSLMPSTDGQPNYVVGDPQDGVVAIKHGDNHLFVNFLAGDCPLWSGYAHLITPNTTKVIQFAPEVERIYSSGNTITLSNTYWNGNHKITYPDEPEMAYGGMKYESPAYDSEGHWNTYRTSCQYYQQLIGQYLVAQNCSETDTHNLSMTSYGVASQSLDGLSAVDIATGESVTMSAAITLLPLSTKVYYISSLAGGDGVNEIAKTGADVSNLQARVKELITFAQDVSSQLSTDKAPDTYSSSAFMPFFLELTRSNYAVQSGTFTAEEIAEEAQLLEQAYQKFLATRTTYDAVQVPGKIDFSKKISTVGSFSVSSQVSIRNAKSGAEIYVPIVSEEKADYLFTAYGKSLVGNEYGSSLNVQVLTPQQYYDKSVNPDEIQTQTIGYSESESSAYKWCIHLEANQTAILRLVFGGSSTERAITIDSCVVSNLTLADRLEVEIGVAKRLKAVYDAAGYLSGTDRTQLSDAISQAEDALSGGNEAKMESAYHNLVAAENDILAKNAIWKQPADVDYNRALTTIQDGDYKIYAEMDGERYYLKALEPSAAECNGAQFTTDAQEATVFNVSIEYVNGVVENSWKITSGKSFKNKLVYFTNPAMSNGAIKNEGYLRVHNRGNKFDYDTQVLYDNGSAIAVRSTNHAAGSWGEDSYWRIMEDKTVGYMNKSAFCWHFDPTSTGIEIVNNDVNHMNTPLRVFTLDGRLLRTASTMSEAVEGLSRGLYIVGGRKMLIK